MCAFQNEQQAREQIKELVAQYYHDFKEEKKIFEPGDRITYAARMFDEKEMCSPDGCHAGFLANDRTFFR